MKTKLLIIFVFVGFLSSFALIPNSEALREVLTVEEMSKRSDAIAVGTIESTWIDVRPFDDYIIVDTAKVKVDKWFKNNKNSDTLEIRYYGYWAKTIDNLRGKFIFDNPLFSYESGQKILLILDHEENTAVMGGGYYPLFEGSFVINDDVAISQAGEQITLQQLYEVLNNNVDDTSTELDVVYPAPLKQIESGLYVDEIQCKEDLVKVIKKSDNMPACIKSESKSKLIQRDWIKFQFSFCGAGGFDSKGNLNKSNSTHHWDENECDWEYVGPVTNSIDKWSGDVPENDKWCNTELIVKTKEKIDQELLKLILLDEIAKFGAVYDMQDRDILLTDMEKNKTKISMDGSWRLKQDRPDIVKALTELIFVDHVEEYHGRLLVVSCQ